MPFLKRVPTKRVPVLKDDEILVELKQGCPGALIGRGTQMKEVWGQSEHRAASEPRTKASGETKPTHTLNLDLQSSKL